GGGEPEDLASEDPGPSDLGRSFNRDAACAHVMAAATLAKKPVDIVLVIDNSGSMTDKIIAVQNNINTNFVFAGGRTGRRHVSLYPRWRPAPGGAGALRRPTRSSRRWPWRDRWWPPGWAAPARSCAIASTACWWPPATSPTR